MSWRDFWENHNGNESLFNAVAQDYFSNFKIEFSYNKKTRALDYGCGPGYLAETLSKKMGEIYIYDISSAMLERARNQNRDYKNVFVLDTLNPDEIPFLDYILANSVIQYITPDKFLDILRLWRLLLHVDGKIIVSDIIPHKISFVREISDLLLYSYNKGYFVGQIKQLASLYFSNYKRIAKKYPLTSYPQHLIRKLSTEAGFEVEFLKENLVCSKYRYTAIMRKTDEY